MSTALAQKEDTAAVVVPEPAKEALPELVIREMQAGDAPEVKEFCLNNLMQRTRLSNQFVYSSPIWLSVFLSTIAWATKTTEPWKRNDWGRWMFLCSALTALFLVGVDYFTYFYYERLTKAASTEDGFILSPKEFLAKKENKCWVAFYANGLVGSIVLHVDGKADSAEISNWFVRARYREKGLGGDLLREALAAARQSRCKQVTLKTSSIHKRANRTLQKSGFKKIESKPETNIYWRMLRISNMVWSIDPQAMDGDALKAQ